MIIVGRPALYRLLQTLPLKKSKAIQGVDNVVAAAKDALGTVRQILSTLQERTLISTEKKKTLAVTVKALERHYQDDLKRCFQRSDGCADHCLTHALTDADDFQFRSPTCDHDLMPGDHPTTCDQCSLHTSFFRELDMILSDEMASQILTIREIGDIRYDLDSVSSTLYEWKAHMARYINQTHALSDVLDWVKERPGERAVIHQDFVMKFPPSSYLEANRDWYAKAGIHWHNSAVTIVSADGTMETTHFSHIFQQTIKQATQAVTAICRHILSTLKKSKPQLKEVAYSSDCAGTYRTANTLAALKSLEVETGLTVTRYDFTEPNAGKSICDRAAGMQKSHVRTYINSGYNVTTAEELVTALRSHGGVLNTAVALVEFQEHPDDSRASLPGISLLRNVKYSNQGLTFWKAYQMGPGKMVSWDKIGQPVLGILTIKSDFDMATVKRKRSNMQPVTNRQDQVPFAVENVSAFNCTDKCCDRSFQTREQLMRHMELGSHHYPRMTAVPLNDLVCQYWVV